MAFNNNNLLFLTILWVRASGRVGWAVLLLHLALVGGSLIQPDSSGVELDIPKRFHSNVSHEASPHSSFRLAHSVVV